MQTNYSEDFRRRQQEGYQRSRNPFEYGQQVAQRRYSEIMAGLDAQRLANQRTYGDMYQEARQRAVGQQAMGGPTLSGGMGQQRRDFVSALEMQELGKIGQAQQQAQADLYAQSQAAFSDAQLEGQQATQMELQNRTAQLQLVQQKQEILSDSSLSIEEKAEQIEALGMSTEGTEIKEKTSFEQALPWAVGGGLTAAGIATYMSIKGITIGAGLAAAGTVLGAAIPIIGIGLVAAAIIGGAAWVLSEVL